MIQLDRNDLCTCDCGTKCPLGKMGMETRCTRKKLEAAGVECSPKLSLFQQGSFILRSGQTSTWKIECEALTKEDWAGLAAIAATRIPPFGEVEGVPRGGIPFADALRPYATEGPLLIAEDVFTTGGSLERYRNGRDVNGVVAFQRGGLCPLWIFPLFILYDGPRDLYEPGENWPRWSTPQLEIEVLRSAIHAMARAWIDKSFLQSKDEQEVVDTFIAQARGK